MHPLIERILKHFCASLVVLAFAAPALASDTTFTCVTNGDGNWSIVASMPTAVECAAGVCTEIRYDITPLKGKSADHVVVLTEHDQIVEPNGSRTIHAPCDGDSVTDLGVRDCSSQAVRLNSSPETEGTFNLVVEGEAIAVASSIVVKKGRVIEECGISSLGSQVVVCDPKAQQSSKETFQFGDCEIEIAIDPCTGAPGDATVVEGSAETCKVDSVAITDLQVVINGEAQNVTVGDGWLSSGENSCTTRFYRRKPYVICDCTDASDPSPPCPCEGTSCPE
jgi:hypothetical protein